MKCLSVVIINYPDRKVTQNKGVYFGLQFYTYKVYAAWKDMSIAIEDNVLRARKWLVTFHPQLEAEQSENFKTIKLQISHSVKFFLQEDSTS